MQELLATLKGMTAEVAIKGRIMEQQFANGKQADPVALARLETEGACIGQFISMLEEAMTQPALLDSWA